MNIQTVADNLRNTIAGKEKYRDEVRKMLNDHGNYLTVREKELQMQAESFLVVNIDELRRILQDVEQCVKQAADDSWAGAVDRQGGSFTDEELDPNRGWK
jgi:hypothetical protein